MAESIDELKLIVDREGEDEWYDTKAITRYVEKIHKIKWSIEEFSKFPFSEDIVSPDFHLTSGCLVKIAVYFFKNGVSGYCMFLYLKNKSKIPIKILSTDISLGDCKGKKWFKFATENNFILQVEEIEMRKEIARDYQDTCDMLNSLTNDILVFECCLKFEDIVSTAIENFRFEVKSPSRLSADMKLVLQNSFNSDVSLRLGKEEVRSHWWILCARSPYFKRMFELYAKERRQNVIVFNDISEPTLQKFLEFLYTGAIEELKSGSTLQEVYDVYCAASTYEVKDLKEICTKVLMSRCTVDCASQILSWADRHHDEDLKEQVLSFIISNFGAVVETDSWKGLVTKKTHLASYVLGLCAKKLKGL